MSSYDKISVEDLRVGDKILFQRRDDQGEGVDL